MFLQTHSESVHTHTHPFRRNLSASTPLLAATHTIADFASYADIIAAAIAISIAFVCERESASTPSPLTSRQSALPNYRRHDHHHHYCASLARNYFLLFFCGPACGGQRCKSSCCLGEIQCC